MTLILKASNTLTANAGAFQFAVSEDRRELLLPTAVMQALNVREGRPAIEFFVMAQTFPTSLAKALKWQVEDVGNATRAVAEYLIADGLLPAEILNQPPKRPGSYGALPPRGP